MSQTNDNVVAHPLLKFNRAVSGLQQYDTSKFVRLFVEAVEEGYPRAGLLQLVTEDRLHKGVSTPSARDFIAWCRAIGPHLVRPSDRTEVRDEPSEPSPEDLGRERATKLREDAERILASDNFDLVRWIEAGDESAETFLAWQRDNRPSVATTGIEAAEAYSLWSEERMQARQDDAVEAAAGAFEAVFKADKERKTKGESHRYWYFAPAWQVDSAFWREWFGEDDPAQTIAFYFKNAFKSSSAARPAVARSRPPEPESALFGKIEPSMAEVFAGKQSARLTTALNRAVENGLNFMEASAEPYHLHDEDLAIMRWIFVAYSGDLARSPGYQQPKAPKAALLRALTSASGWEKWIEGGLNWRDRDFLDVAKRMPDWLFELIRGDWDDIELGYYGEAVLTDQEKAHRTDHVRFFAGLLTAYATSSHDPSIEHLKRSYSDYEISSFISDLTEERYHENINGIRGDVISAIIRGRQSVFGGVLPFTAEDIWLQDFDTGNGAPWLVRLDCFLPERLGGSHSPFWVFQPDGQEADQGGERRTDPRAMKRFTAFKTCLADMQGEGLDDLATAWWAFYVATQPLAFEGFGLPAPLIKEMAVITASLLPHPGLEKALRYALGVSARSAHPLEARAVATQLGPLLTSRQAQPGKANMDEYSSSHRAVESYLVEMIGVEMWSKLHPQSRLDLIETERMWSDASRQLGSREDWGSLIRNYSCVVDREIRLLSVPVVNFAKRLGIDFDLRGLGSYLHVGRKVREKLSVQNISPMDVNLEKRVNLLERIRKSYGDFITGTRNAAAHGDVQKRIEIHHLEDWRYMMYYDGVIAELASLS